MATLSKRARLMAAAGGMALAFAGLSASGSVQAQQAPAQRADLEGYGCIKSEPGAGTPLDLSDAVVTFDEAFDTPDIVADGRHGRWYTGIHGGVGAGLGGHGAQGSADHHGGACGETGDGSAFHGKQPFRPQWL